MSRGSSGSSAQLLGYKVLTKNDQGSWNDDWTNEIFVDVKMAEVEADGAKKMGHEPLVVALWIA